MAQTVILVRVIALGFIAECSVCTRWIYAKLPWKDLGRADDLKCPVCGGSCVADTDTVAMEYEVSEAKS